MGRCSNNDLLNKIGKVKANKNTTVLFSVLTDVDRCDKVNARNYIETKAATNMFNKYLVPGDMFNCLAEGCRNSGTLMLQGAAGEAVSAKYRVAYDATEYYAGLVTYYAHLPEPGEYTAVTTMSDITNVSQSNADVYQTTITAPNAGFYPIVVDFSKTPDEVKGDGWAASEGGAVINVAISAESDDLIADFGISSFYFYDSVEDFEVNDVVEVGCLSEMNADFTIDATDATCFGAGYDPDSQAIEYTVTGKKITPNGWKLSPGMVKGEATEGWFPQSDQRTVQETTINGTRYGYIQAPDMFIEECGFTKVMLADNCNVTDSDMQRVNSPVPISINEREFIVLDGTTTVETDAGKILVHEDLINQTIIAVYPKRASVEEFTTDDNAVGERRVRMYVPEMQSDKVQIGHIFDNVLITSFPMSIAFTEEATFSFTISIQRDSKGRFFRKFREIA